MAPEWLARLGAGVVLGWAALPLLARLARRARSLPPRAYHRTLALALLLALALIAAPSLGALAGTLLPSGAARLSLSLDTVRVAAEWAEPLIGASPGARLESPLRQIASVVAAVWLGAVAFGGLGLCVALARTARVVARAVPAPDSVRERAAALARVRGVAPPKVVVSPDCAAPLTAGLLDAVIVLAPHDLAVAAALDFVLRHELEHVARQDTRAAFALRLAQLAFIGHPSARALAKELAFAREASVDLIAGAEAPLDYARFLVSSAERLSQSRPARLTALSMHDTALSRRIHMLVSPPSPSRSSRRSALLVTTLGTALFGATFCAPAALTDEPIASTPADERVAVSGRLDPELIRQAVRERYSDFRRCYEEQVPKPRPVTGAEMHFVIGPDGRVSSGHVDTQPFVELGHCATAIMMSLTFPPPEGGSVSVAYPLEFAPPAEGASEMGDAPGASEAMRMRTASGPTPPALPPDVIRQVVRESYPGFRDCYERLPQPRPTLSLKMHFTIGGGGRVVDGHVDAEASPELGSCVDGVMRQMAFPGPEEGTVTVGYPIAFAPGQ